MKVQMGAFVKLNRGICSNCAYMIARRYENGDETIMCAQPTLRGLIKGKVAECSAFEMPSNFFGQAAWTIFIRPDGIRYRDGEYQSWRVVEKDGKYVVERIKPNEDDDE